MKRFTGLILTVLLLCSLAVPAFAAEEGYEKGQKLPDFTVTTFDGREISLYETLEEKDLVLINIWATWCPPCRMEFPYMEEAYLLYRDDIEIIALSCEPSDSDKALAAFVEEMGMSFPVARDTAGLARKLNVSAIPLSLIVDKEGIIRYMEVGAKFETEAFAELFEQYISDDAAENAAEPSGDADYAVSFVDSEGKGIPGVMLQVCDESICQVFVSDAGGRCAFTLPAYEYELHLLMLPEGWAYSGETTLYAPAKGGELVIKLDRQS